MSGVKNFGQIKRFFASQKITKEQWLAAGYGTKHQANWRLWRKITFFVGFPLIALAGVNAYFEEKKHPHERPPFVKYEYMRRRIKPFPWGDGNKTLFHNPHMNALPDGYEDELE